MKNEHDSTSIKSLRKKLQLQEVEVQQITEQLEKLTKAYKQLENAYFGNQEKFNFIFDSSPVCLAIYDGSNLLQQINSLVAEGVEDFPSFFEDHPQKLVPFIRSLKTININRAALKLAGLANKEEVPLEPEMVLSMVASSFIVDLISLIADREEESVGYVKVRSLEEKEKHILYRWSVFPKFKDDYSYILLSAEEITSQTLAETRLQLAIDRLQLIQKIQTNILAAESPKAIAEIVLDNLTSIIPTLFSSITLIDSQYRYVETLAGINIPLKADEPIPISQLPVWERLVRGQTVIINDILNSPISTPRIRALLEYGSRSMLITPLMLQGQPIGIIGLTSDSPNYFSNFEAEFVQQIGGFVAMAIHNSNLLETERKARREADILMKVASNINATLGQEKMLDQILTQLALVLPYDSASILQYSGGELTVSASSEPLLWHELNKILKPIPNNIKRLIALKQPIIIPDCREDPDWIVSPAFDKTRCWLGVPLIARGVFAGLLMLDKWEANFYTDHSAKLALAFANHVAITIENARLYRETQHYGEFMQEQVALRTRDLSALYDITATMSQFSDLRTILDKVVKMIAVALDCRTVTILLINETGDKFKLVSSVGFPPPLVEFAQEMPVNQPLFDKIVKEGEMLFISDAYSHPLIKNLGINFPYSSFNVVGAGIRAKEKLEGVIAIARANPQPFSRYEIALLTSINDQIGIAVENNRLRKQAEKHAITQERERLARDLHDSVTQSLFSLTLFAASAQELLHSETLYNEGLKEAESFLEVIANTANQTHKEMRLLLYELRPSSLARQGLVGALRQRLETVENRSGIQTHISDPLPIDLPAKLEQTLFQVANEALNNTLKHSRASKVSINIEAEESWILMEIRDNGIGFNIKHIDQGASIGLVNMAQRMAAINGKFRCYSAPGEGTKIVVSAEIPC